MPDGLHPRTVAVQRAEIELQQLVSTWIEAHSDLTYLEIIRALNGIQANWLRYAIRNERHPNDPDKKGDEA